VRPDLSFLYAFLLSASFAAPDSGNIHELGFAEDPHKSDQFIHGEDFVFDPQLGQEEGVSK